ncbi:hypothetical protein PMAYCL1PPCAC_13885, partial [Pristionchus mayeri]
AFSASAMVILSAFFVAALCRWALAVEYDPPDCSERADGHYGGNCLSKFHTCRAGHVITSHCPHGLYFDRRNKRCDYPSTIDGCHHLKNELEAPDFDCDGLRNGPYSLPNTICSPTYVICHNEVASTRACPNYTVFDEEGHVNMQQLYICVHFPFTGMRFDR